MAMNLLQALAPTTISVDPIEGIQGRVAFSAALTAVKAQNEMAKETVRVLDPNIGRIIDAKAYVFTQD